MSGQIVHRLRDNKPVQIGDMWNLDQYKENGDMIQYTLSHYPKCTARVPDVECDGYTLFWGYVVLPDSIESAQRLLDEGVIVPAKTE